MGREKFDLGNKKFDVEKMGREITVGR